MHVKIKDCTTWFVLVLGLCACVPVSAEGEGRYRLFQGKFSHWNGVDGSTSEHNEMFRIDTVSGDVDIYVSSNTKDGKQQKYWTPIVVDETQSPFGIASS